MGSYVSIASSSSLGAVVLLGKAADNKRRQKTPRVELTKESVAGNNKHGRKLKINWKLHSPAD